MFCVQMRRKLNFFGTNAQYGVWRKKALHLHQNLILAVKPGGGSIMAWDCFAASGPGQPPVTDGKMNSKLSRNFTGEC
ncbi:hypothetical protein LDENG_00199880 [Lucifuga dentata]|nr:hypothetical protein LDENG_00199880 [Lucifuga dentata]